MVSIRSGRAGEEAVDEGQSLGGFGIHEHGESGADARDGELGEQGIERGLGSRAVGIGQRNGGIVVEGDEQLFGGLGIQGQGLDICGGEDGAVGGGDKGWGGF